MPPRKSKTGVEDHRPDARRRLKLRAYRPALSQGAHHHSSPHLSLVLDGSLIEDSEGSEARVGAGMFAVRGNEFLHEVRFGPRGALIVSLTISAEQFADLGAGDVGRWVQGSNQLVRSAMASALYQKSEVSLEDAVWDILAGTPVRAESSISTWLLRSRDRLVEENADIGSLAIEAGVHRVHFSRTFARAFGMPPSIYRRRFRAFRAITAAIAGKAAAQSAYETGFADQSHMSRVLRQMTGTSFRNIQSLGANVTSVQE